MEPPPPPKRRRRKGGFAGLARRLSAAIRPRQGTALAEHDPRRTLLTGIANTMGLRNGGPKCVCCGSIKEPYQGGVYLDEASARATVVFQCVNCCPIPVDHPAASDTVADMWLSGGRVNRDMFLPPSSEAIALQPTNDTAAPSVDGHVGLMRALQQMDAADREERRGLSRLRLRQSRVDKDE